MQYSNRNTKIWNKLFQKLSQNRKKNQIFYSKNKIFASWSGTMCEKCLRFRFDSEKQINDFIWYGHEAKIGDAIHAEIQKDFVYYYKDKVKVENYFPIVIGGIKINAKIDMIKEDKLIIELKTVKDDEGKEPRDKDYLQLQFYMGVTGIKKGVLSYFKRSNGTHINTFEIEYDESVYNEIVEKFNRVIKGSLLRSNQEECKYCPYKHKCDSYDPPNPNYGRED